MEELPKVVAAAVAAVNRHDADAFLSTFAKNGAVDDWGLMFTGHDAIRGWSDKELIGRNATLDVTSVEATDDGVSIMAQVGGDGFNGPSRFIFTLDGDAIAEMKVCEK